MADLPELSLAFQKTYPETLKLARKHKKQHASNHTGNKKHKDNLIDIQSTEAFKRKRANAKFISLIPRNTQQEEYIEHLTNAQKRIVFAIGPAGTGKTMLAVLQAIKELSNGNINKIIITRPAVGVADEDHGFLPGDINAKMEPWVLPVLDIFEEYFTTEEIKGMIAEKIIEICPLMYVRGRTFKHTAIILDEAQNTTQSQMKAILTRMGEGTRMFVTGDLNQTDLGHNDNGLYDFFERFNSRPSSSITCTEFKKEHVERDPIVKEVLHLYGEE